MEQRPETVDAIIVGSGQGGVPLAVSLAKEGRSVVLFERDHLGGSCVNYGCTPSKAFLAAAHGAGRARSAAKLGVHCDVRVDFPAVMDRTRGIVADWRSSVAEKLEKAKVRIVRAEASFSGVRTIAAAGRTYTAPLIVIDTGTSAQIPPIPGLARTPYLDNKSFFAQTVLPKRLAVIGGGYIGLELGQGMARCGSEVHLIEHSGRVLSVEEPDVSAVLAQALERDGIHVHLESGANGVAYDGGFTIDLGKQGTLRTDALLVAAGRTPNTAALAPEKSNIMLDDRGYVTIDDRFTTTCEGVYAIGDVAGQPAFTHVSWEDYRRLTDILKGGTRTRDDRVLAYAVFTEPQVGRAGLTLKAAKAKGLDARSVRMEMDAVARAVEWGEDLGFYELVVENGSGKILGATLVGYEAGELVHEFVAHMMAGSTWQLLDRSVHIHPTYSEGFPSLARMLDPAQ